MLLAGLVSAGVLYVQAVSAVPQRTPYTNKTSSPTSSANYTCQANCTVTWPMWEKVHWQPIVITTTITAARIISIINKKANTTRATTKYNELPSGYALPSSYALPDTNSAGTHVTTLVRSDYIAGTNFSTVLAYPTEFSNYNQLYSWHGVLPTSTHGITVCATGADEDMPLPSSPTHPSPPISLPTDGDKFGTNFVAAIERHYDPEFYRTAYPDVQAFHMCDATPTVTAYPSVWYAASFLTVTSTSYESNEKTAAPTCVPDCEIDLPSRKEIYWSSASITTTITAATVIPVVDKEKNTTITTITKYNELPSGYTLPETNSAGTRVTTLVRSDYVANTNFTTVLAYPTIFNDYDETYRWYGVLPTSTNSQALCATVNITDFYYTSALLPSHPPKPVSTVLSFPPDGDRLGVNYVARTMWPGLDHDREFYISAFPDVQAIQFCSSYVWSYSSPYSPSYSSPYTSPYSSSYSSTYLSIGSATATPISYSNAQGSFSSPWATASFLTETSISYRTQVMPAQSSSSTRHAPPTVDASTTSTEKPSPPVSNPSTTLQGLYKPSTTPVPPPVDASLIFHGNPSLPVSIPPTTLQGLSNPSTLSVPPPVVTSPTPSANPSPQVSVPPETLHANSIRESSSSRSVFPVVNPVSSYQASAVATSPNAPNAATAPPTSSAAGLNPQIQTSRGFSDTAVFHTAADNRESAVNSTTAAVHVTSTSNAYSANSGSQNIKAGPSFGGQTLGPSTVSAIAAPVPLLTYGGSTYTANSVSQYIVGSQTIAIGTQKLGATSAPITEPPILSLNGGTYTANSASQYIIGTQTIGIDTIGIGANSASTMGPPVLTFNGNRYTANSASQYIVGAQTIGITRVSDSTSASTPALPILNLDGSSYTANSASQYVIGSQTLGITFPAVPTSATAPALPILTAGGSTYTANSASQYVVNSQTFGITFPAASTPAPIPAQPVLTFGGSTYTANSASEFVIVGQTFGITFASASASANIPIQPNLTFGGRAYTANSASQYVIEGQTLGLGSTITLGFGSSRTVVEEHTATNGATEIVLDVSGSRSTSTLAPTRGPTPVITQAPSVLTVAGHTYTANALTQYSLAPGVTLTPGGVVTLNGTRISLAPSESYVVVGSSTETLWVQGTTRPASANGGSGHSVTSASPGENPSVSVQNTGNGTGVVPFTGGTRSERGSGLSKLWFLGVGFAGILGNV